ncbi:MAG: Surface antigen [Myxococcales bacterium]|nr:Surface antigen [Myxococcales bacterium]
MKHCLRLALVVAAVGCSGSSNRAPVASSTIALSADGRALWVVNPDADSVTVIDPATRAVVAEVALGPPPAVAANGRFEPAIKPRALAILPSGDKVYVAAQTANQICIIDARKHTVLGSLPVGASPTGVVAAPDGSVVYAVSHEANTITKIDAKKDVIVGTLDVPEHPWGASISADGRSLYVTHLLTGSGVTTVDTASFTVKSTVAFAEQPRNDTKTLPQGVARGVYTAVPHPTTGELWAPHLLLAILTPEPALDFQSTVFPTISTLDPSGAQEGGRLNFTPIDDAEGGGAFNDVVSGPRDLAFSPDGKLALVADSQSEDVMVFDAVEKVELGLVRPLPASFLEGIAVDHLGRFAYVHGRNSQNVVVLRLDAADKLTPAAVDGDPIKTVAADPMPANLRHGQRLFYTANSAAFPITQNFWVACSSCHLEGATDAVTWRFFVGPRDTPSNAGGPINTGFLLRQALRNSITDYDVTIQIEQGGTYHKSDARHTADLQALADFVNLAIPFPQNPNRSADGTLTAEQQHGRDLFLTNCKSCHSGEYLTDSATGNPTLDLAGPIVLHDVGTCVQAGDFVDQPAPDELVGKMHTACDFDTPSLRGIFATAPYFHDGSAATLRDVVDRLPFSSTLSGGDKDALVAYVKTL